MFTLDFFNKTCIASYEMNKALLPFVKALCISTHKALTVSEKLQRFR